VAKINPSLSGAASLVYATYLGGSGAEVSLDDVPVFSLYNSQGGIFHPNSPGLAVDGTGDAYVAGWTTSRNFPTTMGAYQTGGTGANGVAYVTKLNPNGSGLVYSTLLGKNSSAGPTAAATLAVDGAGNAYVAGVTYASTFPTVNAIQGKLKGTCDAFVTTLNASGSKLLFSTYLGGGTTTMFGGDDFATGIAVDGAGNTYVTGVTSSASFPTTAGAYQATYNPSNGSEGFVTLIDPPADGSSPAPQARPFHGRVTATWDNIFNALTNPPATFTGSGLVTHMGQTTQAGWLVLGPPNADGLFPGYGSVTITAANGDTLSFDYTGLLNPVTGEGKGTFTFTGGTGRFAHATGTGTFDAFIDLSQPGHQPMTVTLDRDITY
jgi:hypothetical protein